MVDEMAILIPVPITVVLAGKEISVKKLSVRKQFEAGTIFSEKPAEGVTESQNMADRMIKIVSLATGISYDDLDAACTMQEVTDAFKAIWTQNGFDRFTQSAAKEKQA
jgi:hypothetical protein